jgi:ABC-type microcin C transport system permease subunit YejB
MRVVGRFALPGVVFALLVVLLFWGGSLVGRLSGHWETSLDINEYARLLQKR